MAAPLRSPAPRAERLKILLVDDQPAKLLSYEVILADLGEELLKARSGAEALDFLLKNEVAVMLVDVSMPGLDGFQLAEVIRSHPRFERLAIIFVSAIHLAEEDILRGYQLGAVDYVPVPIVPELLKAKVGTFLELHRKTKALEKLNAELEERVASRTEALEAASQRHALLAREVDHRARNTLAMVQAIVSLTRAEDAKSFAEAIHGRIRSMARAHQLLSHSRWYGADLNRIAREELAPYCDAERASIHGPRVLLNPAAAQMVALAIHELTTNAVKHGALSSEEGRVELDWTLEGDEMRLTWREKGGSPAVPPSGRGFGMTVIEASLSAQLQGSVDLQWLPEGLVCTATLPREALMAPIGPSPPTRSPDRAGEGAVSNGAHPGGRVLLVEDEALVALDLSQMIAGMGFEVVGPLHDLQLALEEPLDGVDIAVLDVNVAGKEVYPLSEALMAKQVPVVFLTGYDREAVRNAASAAAVLQKPIQPTLLRDTLARVLEERPAGGARARR
jgi:two-component sensor histidine kinase/two-component SAPR family response regulator